MKKVIATTLLTSLLFASCGKEAVQTDSWTKERKHVKSMILEKKEFTENLKLIWKVESWRKTSVSPLTAWKISAVRVKIWDQVSTWDVLATLNTQSNLIDVSMNNANNAYKNTLVVYNSTKEQLEKNLETAKLQYENAVSSRNNTYDSAEKQLQLAQANVDSASSQKTNTAKSSESTERVAEDGLENAKLALENFNRNAEETMLGLKSKKKSALDSMNVSIANSLASFDTTIAQIDSILWITEKNKNSNDEFETYLSAKDTSYKNQAEPQFLKVSKSYAELQKAYGTDMEESELLSAFSGTVETSDELIELCNMLVSILDNSITSSSFSASTLSVLKTSIQGSRSQTVSMKSSLVTLKSSYVDIVNSTNATVASNESQKRSLEQAVKMAQSSLENTRATAETWSGNLNSSEKTAKIQLESSILSAKSSRDSADNAVAVAKAQYESALASYNSSLASNKSQLDNAAGNKNSSEQQLSNSVILAPFDGVVTEKNVEIGQSVSSATQAFSVSDSSLKIIQLDVTSDNIRYFPTGKELTLKNGEESSTGTVSAAGVSADSQTGMYRVEVTFKNQAFSDSLTLGSYVDAYAKKGTTQDRYVIVPFSSLVVWSGNSYSVYVIGSEWKVTKREVTVWVSNSNEAVINSGVKEGEKIVVEWTLNVSDGDLVVEA